MEGKFQYRLSKEQKVTIADNLIGIFEKGEKIKNETRAFINNWIRTGPEEKRKAFYDVWDIVLKNYLPDTRPVLFRSCSRKNMNGRIASFTCRFECARRFSSATGFLLVCDTGELLKYISNHYSRGSYKHTFFPLSQLLRKAKEDGGWGFSERILDDGIGEDEYIMRLSPANTYSFRWS